jgi:hypothetical protein
MKILAHYKLSIHTGYETPVGLSEEKKSDVYHVSFGRSFGDLSTSKKKALPYLEALNLRLHPDMEDHKWMQIWTAFGNCMNKANSTGTLVQQALEFHNDGVKKNGSIVSNRLASIAELLTDPEAILIVHRLENGPDKGDARMGALDMMNCDGISLKCL